MLPLDAGIVGVHNSWALHFSRVSIIGLIPYAPPFQGSSNIVHYLSYMERVLRSISAQMLYSTYGAPMKFLWYMARYVSEAAAKMNDFVYHGRPCFQKYGILIPLNGLHPFPPLIELSPGILESVLCFLLLS